MKISELISFSINKFGSTPVYLQQLESYIAANSYFHIDVLDENIFSGWAINKFSFDYELVINQTDGEKDSHLILIGLM